jgi:hypothetical protein
MMNSLLTNGQKKTEERSHSRTSSKFNLDNCTKFIPKKIFFANPNSATNSLMNSQNSLNMHENGESFVKIFNEQRPENNLVSVKDSEEEFELFVSPTKRLLHPLKFNSDPKDPKTEVNNNQTQSNKIMAPENLLLFRRESLISGNMNFNFTPTNALKFNLMPINADNGSPRNRTSRKLEVPNYNLKRTLFVYFYHREMLKHYPLKYTITDKELSILKIILKKKLIYDKKHFKKDFQIINGLNQETYIDFMMATPPIFRKNIIKSKLFKKIVKYIISDESIPLSVTASINLKEDFSQMTNSFYDKCFAQADFKVVFLNMIKSDTIMKSIVTKCKRQFVKRVDEWILALDKNIAIRDSISPMQCNKNNFMGDIKHIRMATSREEVEEAKRLFLEYV